MDLRHLVPDPSLDDNTPSRRRGSSSSTPSIGSTGPSGSSSRRTQRSRTHRPKLSLNSTIEPRDTSLEASSSRRESASSMLTASTMDESVTYTPTTHRISKAKKGKRVHACEYPGCNKVCHVEDLAVAKADQDIRSLLEQNIEGQDNHTLHHLMLTGLKTSRTQS